MKVLPYCAFLHRDGLEFPETGVGGAPIQVMQEGDLRLLWSQVNWPFPPDQIQKSAVEFHQVVTRVFSQIAVVPFRLLSVFDGPESLAELLRERRAEFTDDLKRLHDFVQMECVAYLRPPLQLDSSSGKAYLESKAELMRQAGEFSRKVETALGDHMAGMRTREVKAGIRIFVLVERSKTEKFRSLVEQVPLPGKLARRMSGPWPPAEFLSDSVKMPQKAAP